MDVTDSVRRIGACLVTFGVWATVAGCAGGQAGRGFAVDEKEWGYKGVKGRILSTPNFEIYTTVQDAALLEIMPSFAEESYQRYVELLPSGAGDRGRLKTYVFEMRRQWDNFTRENAPPSRAAVYLRIQSGGYTEGSTAVLHLIGRERTLSVLAHEGFHQYVASRFDEQIPAWLNEGLACYCEAFEVRDQRPVFTPMRNTFRINHLRTALNAQRLIPLEELLATHAGNIIQLGGEKVSTYYAESWALMVFLRHGANKAYRKGFSRMLADAGTKNLRQSADAFKAAGGGADLSFGGAVFRHYVCDDLKPFNDEFYAFLLRLVGFAPGGPV